MTDAKNVGGRPRAQSITTMCCHLAEHMRRFDYTDSDTQAIYSSILAVKEYFASMERAAAAMGRSFSYPGREELQALDATSAEHYGRVRRQLTRLRKYWAKNDVGPAVPIDLRMHAMLQVEKLTPDVKASLKKLDDEANVRRARTIEAAENYEGLAPEDRIEVAREFHRG